MTMADFFYGVERIYVLQGASIGLSLKLKDFR